MNMSIHTVSIAFIILFNLLLVPTFVRKRNWIAIPGLCIFALGASLNLLTILINHGKMPVKNYYSGAKVEDNIHTAWRTDSKLEPLIDKYGNDHFRYSLGDVLIVLGFPLISTGLLPLLRPIEKHWLDRELERERQEREKGGRSS